jgi:hypothetical protein
LSNTKPKPFNNLKEIIMRNYFMPVIKDVKTVQLGATRYALQYYYPNGGSQYVVYVYKRDRLQDRGRTYTPQQFDHWLAKQQIQGDLFDY